MRLRKKPWIETAMEELKDKYVLMHNLENYKGHWQERFPGTIWRIIKGTGRSVFPENACALRLAAARGAF